MKPLEASKAAPLAISLQLKPRPSETLNQSGSDRPGAIMKRPKHSSAKSLKLAAVSAWGVGAVQRGWFLPFRALGNPTTPPFFSVRESRTRKHRGKHNDL